MRHKKAGSRLGRNTPQKKALLRGLVRNLLLHQRIETTKVKAKAAQRWVDKLITLGKADTVHARRQANRVLDDRTLVKTLFTEIAPLFKDRQGGYTRVLQTGLRSGDKAPMAILELVEKTSDFGVIKPKTSKTSKPEATASKESAAVTEEAPTKTAKQKQDWTKGKDKDLPKGDSKNKKKSFMGGLQKFFKRKGQD